jgi:hypothetical protein
MSGEDSNSSNNNDSTSLREMMQAMMSSINNIDQKNINNMNSLREDLAVSMSHLREDLNSNIKFDITGDEYILNHYSVLTWGSLVDLTPGMVLCDATLIRRYPQIMGNQEERQPG